MRGLVLKACAFRFLDTFLLIVPFYTVMFAERGLNPAQIGVALAAWSVTGLVLEIPSGVLADRVSRRWLLFAAQLVRAVGFVLWIAFPSFWGFLLGLVLWGVKSAAVSGTFEALVYDELAAAGREDDYARMIGRTQAARFSGVVAASLAAAAVSAWVGYPALVAASLAAGIAAAGMALTLPSAPKAAVTRRSSYLAHLRRGAADAVRLPGVLPLMVFISGIQAITLACADYWQLFAREVGLPLPAVALFIAALAAAGAVAAMLAHRMHAAAAPVLYGLIAVAGLSLAVAAATFTLWSIVLPVIFVGLYWVVDVNADARFQHALVGETRATVASVKGFVTQCATTVLILGFGLVAQAGSYRVAFLVYGIAMMALGAAYGIGAWVRRVKAPAA
ncbi:MFS transporter [Phenylobacterium sp.]|uniref:MFS transporter n=1 Tax=Phenylobacterium sp. TaxID=1871053 RepID=UPI0039837EAD